jgi:hypothetical protein
VDLRLARSTPLVSPPAFAVKDRLMQAYPQIADAIIHLEPPPSEIQSTVGGR